MANTNGKVTIKSIELQGGTDKTLYAVWDWELHSDTEAYYLQWEYGVGDGVWYKEDLVTVSRDASGKLSKSALYTPSNESTFHVRLSVKPQAKVNSKNKPRYTSPGFSNKVTFNYNTSGKLPAPSAPTLTIDGTTMTARIEYDAGNANRMIFKFSCDDKEPSGNDIHTVKSVGTNVYSVNYDAVPGHSYKVCCAADNNTYDNTSDDSPYSDYVYSGPPKVSGWWHYYATSATEVFLNWKNISSKYPHDSYVVEYTTAKKYFDNSTNVQTVTVDSDVAGSTYIGGLEPGQTYFFRVRAEQNGVHGEWSDIVSIKLGVIPSAPTTWSNFSKVKTGDDVTLYWSHNAQDSSEQNTAQINITANGRSQTITIRSPKNVSLLEVPERSYSDWKRIGKKGASSTWEDVQNTSSFDVGSIAIVKGVSITSKGERKSCKLYGTVQSIDSANNKLTIVAEFYADDILTEQNELDSGSGITTYYVLQTDEYTTNTTIQWKVRTRGILTSGGSNNDGYSDWSVVRTIDVLVPPTVSVYTANYMNPSYSGVINSFPFDVRVDYRSNSEAPIECAVDIYSTEDYLDIDETGEEYLVPANTRLYSQHFYGLKKELFNIVLSVNDITLRNNLVYRVEATIAMQSGLRASSWINFRFLTVDIVPVPRAEFMFDSRNLTMTIRPYVENENIDPVNFVLSVFRKEYDGSFTKVNGASRLNGETWVTDPYPSLYYANYRIVAMSKSTSAVNYIDYPGYPVLDPAVVIQWDEPEKDLTYEFDFFDPLREKGHTNGGSMLKLPYNVKMSSNNNMDVELVNYIGRKRPVSYYGTQIGETRSFSLDIPKADKRTLFSIRRLSVWTGDVYVREPSGEGFWASVSVTYDINSREVTIPVTINVTRVEGGKQDA